MCLSLASGGCGEEFRPMVNLQPCSQQLRTQKIATNIFLGVIVIVDAYPINGGMVGLLTYGVLTEYPK